MCDLNTIQQKVVVAGLIAADHINFIACWLDYRHNQSRNWARFHSAAIASTQLREMWNLPAHSYSPQCCNPADVDPQGAIAAYAVLTFGINPREVDEQIDEVKAKTPPRQAKSRKEAAERLKASNDAKEREIAAFYERYKGATG